MTWAEEFAALEALADEASLRMRRPGDWYVDLRGVEVGGDGFLSGVLTSAPSPESAVHELWNTCTTLPPDKYLVVHGWRDDRRHFRWNGFMWADVTALSNVQQVT